MIDLTITVGNIIEISTIAIGGIYAFVNVKNSVANFANDLTRMQIDFTDMKVEIRKVSDVLIRMAVADTRLTGLEQDIREMKHGKGFVQDINGEYSRQEKLR